MKYSMLTYAACAALTLGVAGAHASSDVNDVVRDFQGNIIENTFENCVVTKWQSGTDMCAETTISSELLNVYFNFDSAELTPAALDKLNKVVDLLSSASDVKSVDIVGYADHLGNPSYNYRLSERRAEAVRAYLASRGYLNTRDVSVLALGEDQPVTDCSGLSGKELKACLWRDRRVEIKLNRQ